MNTFDKLVNKKLIAVNPISLNYLLKGQKQLGVSIPPDYCFLLLNSDGYSFEKEWQVTIDKQNPIVQVNDFLNLEWLVKERQYDLEDDNARIYRDNFLKIADCFNQDRLLIGYQPKVLNEIHLLDYDENRTIKICDSIFEFIDEHLIG